METARRTGARNSLTRAKLLDAAEQLMVEQGYAAVTSRHVGQRAGISPQLVHYYFATMDDLFLDVFRRRADEGFARFERAFTARPSLRTIWSSLINSVGSTFILEFAALANHRKAIRAEIAGYAERFHALQLEAMSSILATSGPLPGGVTPEVVLVFMAGVAQIIALEQSLGIGRAHEQTLALIEQFLDEADGP